MNRPTRVTLRRIRRLEAKRARIVGQLRASGLLLVGSLSLVKRTCGKPGCHCAQEPAHEAWLLATRLAGAQRRCQVVRQADVKEVQKRVAAYKRFRAGLRDVEALHKELKALLRGLMENRNVPYE